MQSIAAETLYAGNVQWERENSPEKSATAFLFLSLLCSPIFIALQTRAIKLHTPFSCYRRALNMKRRKGNKQITVSSIEAVYQLLFYVRRDNETG